MLTVIGTIDRLPSHFDRGVRFKFSVDTVHDVQAKLPPRIASAWHTGFRDTVQRVVEERLEELWQLPVRLRQPHGSADRAERRPMLAISGPSCRRLRSGVWSIS